MSESLLRCPSLTYLGQMVLMTSWRITVNSDHMKKKKTVTSYRGVSVRVLSLQTSHARNGRTCMRPSGDSGTSIVRSKGKSTGGPLRLTALQLRNREKKLDRGPARKRCSSETVKGISRLPIVFLLNKRSYKCRGVPSRKLPSSYLSLFRRGVLFHDLGISCETC